MTETASKKGHGRKSKQELVIEDMKSRFEAMRVEVGDFDPTAFARIEADFMKWVTAGPLIFKNFRFVIDWHLKKGECPVRSWLKLHNYPITEGEVFVLKMFRVLTEESAKTFFNLMNQYRFRAKNSAIFRNKCDQQEKLGLNPFGVWLFEKNHFNPVFKSQAAAGYQKSV